MVFRLGDCSHVKADRYHASLLKTYDLQTTPLNKSQNRVVHPTSSAPVQLSSPEETCPDSTISLAKVTTIPRCRDSIISTTIVTPQLKRGSLSIDNGHPAAASNLTFPTSNENKMVSFFEPIPIGNISPIPFADVDTRKNGARLPLEAVPETNELDVGNARYNFDPTLLSTLINSHYSNAVQPSPVLITFDSSTLKSRI